MPPRRLQPTPLFLALGLLVTGGSRAAGAEPPSLAGDTRLSAVVSAHAADVPLRGWLHQISEETGIRLRTAADYEDRGLTLRLRKVPLRAAMAAIAGLYGDFWRAEGTPDAPTWILSASLARRDRQRRCREAAEQALEAELRECCREVARDGLPPGRLHPDEVRSGLGDEFRMRGALLGGLPASTVRRLFAGEHVRVEVRGASGAWGTLLRRFTDQYALGWATAAQRETTWVEFSAPPLTGRTGVPARSLAFIVGNHEGAGIQFSLGPMNGPRLENRLRTALSPLRQGEQQLAETRRQLGGASLRRTVPSPERGSESGLTRGELLLRLADAADLPLVADSVTHRRRQPPELERLTVEQALDRVCGLVGAFWRVREGEPPVVTVRSLHWWQDDPAEPPATLAAELSAHLSEAKRLTLEQSWPLGLLTPDQQARLILRLPETERSFGPWLRFFAALTPREREAARGETGLVMSGVPLEKRRLLLSHTDGEPYSQLGNRGYEDVLLGDERIFTVREETREEAPGEPPRPQAVFDARRLRDAKGRTLMPPGGGFTGVHQGVPLPYRK